MVGIDLCVGEHSTFQGGIARLHTESFKASRLLHQPALWLLSVLVWALTEDMDGDTRDEKALDLHDIAGRMFAEGSRSRAVLDEYLGAGTDDQIALFGGAMWSPSHLTALTGTLKTGGPTKCKRAPRRRMDRCQRGHQVVARVES